jgi:hypothetical protein
VISGRADVLSLALLAGVGGAASGFFNPAGTSLLTAVVPAEDLQRANGLRATSMAAGEVAGPIVAGLIVAASGAGWALAVDAASFGVSAVFLSRLRVDGRSEKTSASPARPSSFLGELRDGWREFRARTWVWAFVLAIGVGNMVWGAWSALGPVVAQRDLGGAAAWGTVLAAMGAGGVAGALLAIRAQPRRPLVVVALACITLPLPLALLGAQAPVAVLSIGSLLGGVALTLGNTVWESTLQRNIPGESLGRVSAYDWFGALAFRPLGLALWGPVSIAIGLSSSLWLACGVQFAVGVVLLALPLTWRLSAAKRAPAPG